MCCLGERGTAAAWGSRGSGGGPARWTSSGRPETSGQYQVNRSRGSLTIHFNQYLLVTWSSDFKKSMCPPSPHNQMYSSCMATLLVKMWILSYFRFRTPSETLTRRFYATDTLGTILLYLASVGYRPAEYKVILQYVVQYSTATDTLGTILLYLTCVCYKPAENKVLLQDRTGQDRTGQDRTGQDRTDHQIAVCSTVQYSTVQYSTVHWKTAKNYERVCTNTKYDRYMWPILFRYYPPGPEGTSVCSTELLVYKLLNFVLR